MVHACKRCKFRTLAIDTGCTVCAFERSEMFLCEAYADDVCGLSGDDERVWEENHLERKYCVTCKWYEADVGVCCNDKSEYCADFWEEGCENWEAHDEAAVRQG